MKWRLPALVVVLLGAMLASPALALPDLARGRAALERGDLAAAETDLKPLAERGYLDAQVLLARVYTAKDTPESAALAVRWYRLAVEKDPALRLPLARSLMRSGQADPAEIEQLLLALADDREAAALPLQLRLYREFPQLAEPGQAARLAQEVAAYRLPEDRAAAISWYRANRLEDRAYDDALGALCEKDRAHVEECYADLARHFRALQDVGALKKLQAEAIERFDAGTMSPETVERMARHLAADDLPGKAAPDAAYALLLKIPEPTAEVIARRARLLLAQPALDAQADPVALLKSAYELGSPEAALELGRLYLDELHPAADPVRAESLLREAAKTLPTAHTWLGRLYERGYLGLPEPERALQHYLLAARAGQPNADLALARMYSRNRGVRVDPVQAYGFARLAEHQGHPGAGEFILQLLPGMLDQQIKQGQQLAEREWTARSAIAPPPEAQLATAEESKR